MRPADGGNCGIKITTTTTINTTATIHNTTITYIIYRSDVKNRDMYV